jgi:hypothetical protein
VTVRTVFISYARANKPAVDELDQHLRELGWDPWIDSSLHGGQEWWGEILRQIANRDVFIAIISSEALISEACQSEFDWAEALGKPVLPVAVEGSLTALPSRYSSRHCIDYSDPANRDRAARRLNGSLLSLPPTPPPPNPRPKPPDAPMSYLTGLMEWVCSRDALSHHQQRQILQRLEPALLSVDPDEMHGGRRILKTLANRRDLYPDVAQRITELMPRPRPNPQPQPLLKPEPAPDPKLGQSGLRIAATLIAVAAVIGVMPSVYLLVNDYPPGDRIWYWQVLSRILIGIAFCALAWIATSRGDRFASLCAKWMVVVVVLLVATQILDLETKILGEGASRFVKYVAISTLIALWAVVGVFFGVAAMKWRVSWAYLLIAWGVCGLLEAWLFYEAKFAPWQDWQPAAAEWKAADSVLILQNLILLTVAVVMFLVPRPAKFELRRA